MIDKFVDLVNETVDESFKRGIDLFIESLEEDLMTTHKIVNEGLDAVLEQACSEPEELDDVSESEEEQSEIDKEIDALTVDEIAEAMEEIADDEFENDAEQETE